MFSLLFILSSLALTLFSFLFVDANLIYLKGIYTGFAFQNREVVASIYIMLILISFFIYSNILKNIRMLEFNKFKLTIAIIALILLFSYPAFLSFDIFNYIATAKTLFFYHENPYIVMPVEFKGDPLLLFTHAPNKIALYGPFWIFLTGIPYFLGFGNFLLTLFSFKIFVACFYFGTLYLFWKLSGKNLELFSLFALNPLILIETFMSSHNDIVMIFFALLCFSSLKQRKTVMGLIMLALSILIKYATIFLIPVVIFVLWNKTKGKEVSWEKIYKYSFICMFFIFLLSAFREEIYPWYAIWFLPFSLLSKNKLMLYTSLAFSFGLLLRYIPFMLLGTYFGPTPLIKTLVTFIPLFLVFAYLLIKRKTYV